MQYNHSPEIAKTYAERALARIEQEGLPCNPMVFEVLYVYYSAHHHDIVRSIEAMIQNKEALTEARIADLYNRLLNEARLSEEALSKAEGLVAETMTNVSEAASAVKHKTDDYALDLQKSAAKMSEANSPEALRAVATGIMSKAQLMVSENKQLEAQLMQSAHVMNQLREEIETIRRESMIDAMTGIANRKQFDSTVQRMVLSAHQDKKPLSLLMVDIDHFKNFNDTFGHQVGDQVLKLVARALKEGVKGRDLPARYGGEEFVVVLPETELKAAEIVANALRRAVAEKDIINRTTGDRLGKITLSIGAAELRRGEKPASIIERADTALYSAKGSGRNCVVLG